MGFNPLYRTQKEPRKFQIIGFSVPPRSLIFHFPPLIFGQPSHSEHFLDGVASKVEFRFAEPQDFMMDGEIYKPVSTMTLEQGPVLQVVV